MCQLMQCTNQAPNRWFFSILLFPLTDQILRVFTGHLSVSRILKIPSCLGMMFLMFYPPILDIFLKRSTDQEEKQETRFYDWDYNYRTLSWTQGDKTEDHLEMKNPRSVLGWVLPRGRGGEVVNSFIISLLFHFLLLSPMFQLILARLTETVQMEYFIMPLLEENWRPSPLERRLELFRAVYNQNTRVLLRSRRIIISNGEGR